MLTRLVLAIGLLCALTLGASPARAHATLVSTDPAEGAVLEAPPESVTLTFDESVTLAAAGVRLYNASGEELASEARSVDRVVTVTPPGEMPDGTYVLSYRVISSDSHPVAGALTFSVGAPSETVVAPTEGPTTDVGSATLYGVLHGLMYLALFLAAGLAMFAAVLLPVERRTEGIRSRLRRWVLHTAGVAVVGAVLLVPVGVLYQQGLGLTGLGQSLPWTSWLTGDGLLAGLMMLGLAVAVLSWPRDGSHTVAVRIVMVAGALVALAAPALVGHTRSYGPAALVITSDVVHVTAAAVWFGGLVGVVLALRSLVHQHRLAAQTVTRFSTAAAGLLTAVAVAGLVLGWRILGSWSALVSTPYGIVLLAKVAIVAVVVAVAAWNRFRLLPDVARADRADDPTSAKRRLRRAVRAEAAGLAVVLALTGFLVTQVPQKQTAAAAVDPRTVVETAEEIRVVAHVHPGEVGSNTVTVQVQDLTGEPVEPFAAPSVSVASEGGVDLGSQPARNISSGTYIAEFVIPTPGTWTVQVSVRTGEFVNPVLSVETEIRAGD